MPFPMKIIITIPAYNEAATIGNLVAEIKKVMTAGRYDYEVLVVDDGSSDATAAVAKKQGALVYQHPKNYGLAETFRSELQKCGELKADVIVHIDADHQYLPKEIPLLLKKINEGYDLVLGSRFKGIIEEMPLVKKVGNRAFSWVVSRIAGVPLSDAQTGFRVFTRAVAEKVTIISTHTYTQEQIIKAVKQKFRVVEVPITFAKRHDKSRLISNPFEYALKAWINILRIYRDYEPLKFFGYLGMVFVSVGGVLGLMALYRFLMTGVVGALPRVVLSAVLLIVGVQIILFGFLADMMRK